MSKKNILWGGSFDKGDHGASQRGREKRVNIRPFQGVSTASGTRKQEMGGKGKESDDERREDRRAKSRRSNKGKEAPWRLKKNDKSVSRVRYAGLARHLGH